MQAGGDAVAGKRLLRLEPLADRRQHRHLPVGPGDPAHAVGGEREILHVVAFRRCHSVPFVDELSHEQEALVLSLLPVDPVGGRSARGEPGVDGVTE